MKRRLMCCPQSEEQQLQTSDGLNFREEARRITDEMLHSGAARQLSYDGLSALMKIAHRRLARFSDD
jgi:hypothetical protein